MHNRVLINGSLYPVDYRQSIGIGGEAVVVKLKMPDLKALKLLKTPDYPDFQGLPHAQEQARSLSRLYQHKLPAFPSGLPDHVVTPEALAYDTSGRIIVGYVMRYLQDAELFVRYTQKSFRDQGVPTTKVMQLLTTLWKTLQGVHQKDVIIGDLSELNILVTNHTEPWLIDSDSFGYGQWPPLAYTKRFVDPLLCDQTRGVKTLELVKPQNADSDWRIFSMLVLMCLLYLDPYAGVYEPDDPKEYIPDELRPLHHITIFHPHVIYPSGLPHFSILPDELLEFFVQMFVKEMRGIFPLGLLESLRETTCTRCGKIHYRNLCPHCNQPAPAAIKQRIITQRRVKATEVLKTRGTVLYTTLQHGVYRYLYHENGRYKRGMFKQSRQGTVDQRSDMSVLAGDLDPLRRYRISAESTLIGQSGQIAVITADGQRTRFNVDSYGSLPLFDANGDHMYWVTNGVLLRSGDKIGGLEMPPRRLGTVLTDQTLFWVGAKFGFGFYRIGNLQVAFVFNSEQPGINDSVAIPNLSGQLIDSTCVFSDDHCWFFTTMREAGVTTNRCYVIGVDGLIKATASAPSGSRSWLGTIRGKTAIGLPNSTGAPARLVLFSPSSSGIVQVRLEQDKIEIAADFPETAPFVDANTHLQIAPEGIYAAKNDSIYLLQLA